MSAAEVPALVGLGMSVLDLVQVVGEFPAGGGATRVERSLLMGGGPVPTALCAAARMGIRCAIVDRIGDDWRGQLLREEYHRHGVSTAALSMEKGRRSTLGTVLVRSGDGERHLLFDEGDFTPLGAEELPPGLLEGCRILHLNGRHWPACVAAAERVRAHGGRVSFDGGAHRHDPRFEELFPRVDIFIVAADFADRAVGGGSRPGQLVRLARWGAEIVGITDGVEGSWFFAAGGEKFHQPAFPVDGVVDTTGCGDVFHGVFLAAVLQDRPWRECARLASAAAALAATALGGRGRLPGLEETLRFSAAS